MVKAPFSLNRRQTLKMLTATVGGFASGTSLWGRARYLQGAPIRQPRITDIEVQEVISPLHDYNAVALSRSQPDIPVRTIYIVRTDTGLEGYGEKWALKTPGEDLSQYLGTTPFDWFATTHNMPMSMALYDLMGKILDVPLWKLLGPQVRKWVQVAAWTVSQPPEAMAEEVRQVSARGYRWLKYHVDVFQNAVDQTAAMQEAAPSGFKIHYDFNADSELAAVYPVLKELEKFSVAGELEDPLNVEDHEAWKALRTKCSLPLIFHYGLDPTEFYVRHGLCDGFVASRFPVGTNLRLAALAESTRMPFILQLPGGNLSLAFLAHQAAVYRMATLPGIPLTNLWKDDITVESMPVVAGSVRVPEGPGLGLSLDRQKYEQYAAASRPDPGRFLFRVRYRNGPTLYLRPGQKGQALRTGSSSLPGPVPGYGNAVLTDHWDDDGSQQFRKMWEETIQGPVWQGR